MYQRLTTQSKISTLYAEVEFELLREYLQDVYKTDEYIVCQDIIDNHEHLRFHTDNKSQFVNKVNKGVAFQVGIQCTLDEVSVWYTKDWKEWDNVCNKG